MIELRFDDLLKELGISIPRLAEHLGKTRQSLDQWVHRKARRIDLDKCEEVLAALSRMSGRRVRFGELFVEKVTQAETFGKEEDDDGADQEA